MQDSSTEVDERTATAIQFIIGCAKVKGGLTEHVVADFVDKVKDPGAAVDITGLVESFGFPHRLTALVVPEGEDTNSNPE